jgi:hypothetical protein
MGNVPRSANRVDISDIPGDCQACSGYRIESASDIFAAFLTSISERMDAA